MFTVHVLAMGPAAAALTVTELRGGGYPQVHTAGTDTVPGRGLAVVQALTSVFWVADSEHVRILLATIPAPSDQHHGGSLCPRRGGWTRVIAETRHIPDGDLSCAGKLSCWWLRIVGHGTERFLLAETFMGKHADNYPWVEIFPPRRRQRSAISNRPLLR